MKYINYLLLEKEAIVKQGDILLFVLQCKGGTEFSSIDYWCLQSSILNIRSIVQ